MHPVDQAPVERLGGGHTLAKQRHLERSRTAHGRWHERRGAAVGHQSDVDERQPEEGGLGRKDQIATRAQTSSRSRRPGR